MYLFLVVVCILERVIFHILITYLCYYYRLMLIFVWGFDIILTSNDIFTKFNIVGIVLIYRYHNTNYKANSYMYLDNLKPSNEVIYSFLNFLVAMYSIDAITTTLWRLYILLILASLYMILKCWISRFIMVAYLENIAKENIAKCCNNW